MAYFQKEDACLLGCVCHIDLFIVMAFWRHNSPLKRQSLSASWYGVTCQNTLNLPQHNWEPCVSYWCMKFGMKILLLVATFHVSLLLSYY